MASSSMQHGSGYVERPRRFGFFGRIVRWFFDLTRFWIFTILFFILMVAISYSVVSSYIKGSELEAPNLIGLTLVQAMERLNEGELRKTRLSLTMEGEPQPHPTIEKGAIISQQPEPKRRIKAGTPLRVVISAGAPLATVPELRGQSKIRAGILLKRNNLQLGTEAFLPVAGKPGGVVLATDPPGGTGIVEGTKVNLLLSAGESQNRQMPDLTGLSLAEVREELSQFGLPAAEEIATPGGEEAVPGQVHNQFPAPNDPITPITQIRVYFEPERQAPTADEAVAEETPVPAAQLPDEGGAKPAPAARLDNATSTDSEIPMPVPPGGPAVTPPTADGEDTGYEETMDNDPYGEEPRRDPTAVERGEVDPHAHASDDEMTSDEEATTDDGGTAPAVELGTSQ